LSQIRTKSPAVAEKADRTAYYELINHHLHKKLSHVRSNANIMVTWSRKRHYGKQAKCL